MRNFLKKNKKKISLIAISLSLMLILTTCLFSDKYNGTVANPIPKDCMIAKLSFNEEIDKAKAMQDATDIFILYEDKLNLPSYLVDNETVLATNSKYETSNPYEELSYIIEDESRILTYRYISHEDIEKFDEKYVTSQIKEIFGIDLSEYEDYTEAIEELQKTSTKIEDNHIIPMRIETGNEVSITISLTKKDNIDYLSIVGKYGY